MLEIIDCIDLNKFIYKDPVPVFHVRLKTHKMKDLGFNYDDVLIVDRLQGKDWKENKFYIFIENGQCFLKQMTYDEGFWYSVRPKNEYKTLIYSHDQIFGKVIGLARSLDNRLPIDRGTIGVTNYL